MTDPDERSLLPDRTSDETETGWGDELESADDLRRFLDEVPPHHVD
ncbi:MAG: hypothetical protein QOJ03_2851 [Frankiaceae bacterium]|nr:hypothetical protein [Frankiaceae bacterium]